jgi:CheY-like chemotaxis protein
MKTVLIVEDEPGNREGFRVLLGLHHFHVVEAATGHEALEASRWNRGPIDLALCDLQLPDMSGTEVALDLVKSHPETAIIFISGTPLETWSDFDVRNLTQLPRGAACFLEKPFLPSTLETKVEECLKIPRKPVLNSSCEKKNA